MSSELDTYPKFIIQNMKLWGDRVALRRKIFGIWQDYTWNDCYEKVAHLCLGLVDLGLKPGDKVSLIGDEKPEGFIAEAAVQAAGGVIVAMWSDSISSEIAYFIKHSDSKFVIAEGQEQVDKILEIKNDIPAVQKVIYWDDKGMRSYEDPILINYDDVMISGNNFSNTHPDFFEELVAMGKGTNVAAICYTPGTASLPKGVMLTHNAIINSAKRMHEHAPVGLGEDIITTLSSASVFHHWCAGFGYIWGVVINFPEATETLMDDYREISPRFILITPRQWQSLYSMTQMRINDADFLKRFFYNIFLPVGYKVADLHSSKKKITLMLKLFNKLGDMFVFAPLRDKLGLSKTKYPVTGGAFLSSDLFRFFRALGIKLSQVYSSTEAGVVSMHFQDDIDNDSVGKICQGVEIQISDEQEILIKSASIFSGYYKDDEKTELVMRDGWLHTGDSGYINETNHLIYIDRIDSLDELSTGHRYAPTYIEAKLKFSRFVKDVIVIGRTNNNFLCALIILDFEGVGKWAETNRLIYTTFVDLAQKEEVSNLIRKDLIMVNNNLPEGSRVCKFVILHKEFDADEGDLTRTRTLRRSILRERYKDLIAAIYNNKTEILLVTEVKYSNGRNTIAETNLKIRTVYEKMGSIN